MSGQINYNLQGDRYYYGSQIALFQGNLDYSIPADSLAYIVFPLATQPAPNNNVEFLPTEYTRLLVNKAGIYSVNLQVSVTFTLPMPNPLTCTARIDCERVNETTEELIFKTIVVPKVTTAPDPTPVINLNFTGMFSSGDKIEFLIDNQNAVPISLLSSVANVIVNKLY